jgi:hypothetical protein
VSIYQGITLNFDLLLTDLISGKEDKRILSAETIFSLAESNSPILDTNNIYKLTRKMEEINQRLEPDIVYFIDTFTLLYKRGEISNDVIDRWLDGQNNNCLEILVVMLPLLEDKKQQEVSIRLFNVICTINENHILYSKFINYLKECNLESVLQLAVKNLSYTDTKIMLSLDVLTIYGNKSHNQSLLNILDKIIVKGYQYAGNSEVIQRKILKFYFNTMDVSLINPLISFLNFKVKLGVWQFLSDVLVTVEDEAVIPIADYIYLNTDKPDAINLLLNALSKMRTDTLKKIDINKLFTTCYTLNQHFPRDGYLNLILTKYEKGSIPIIKKLLEGSDRNYEFAHKVILNRGEIIRDYGKSNTMLIINDIIVKELQNDKNKDIRIIDSLITKDFKGNKKEIIYKMDKFEYLITNLLISSGFITQFIDIDNQKGIDIIALSPSTDIFFIVGCTTANITGDDNKLLDQKIILSRHKLKIDIVPIIAISLYKHEISGYDEIKNKGIKIITKDDISNLYDMMVCNRPHEEILSYILDRKII